MNALVSTFILLAGLAQNSAGTYTSQTSGLQNSLAVPQVVVASEPFMGVVASAEGGSVNRLVLADNGLVLPDQAHESVLVLPTPDLPAESMAELTEDMTVMCRIFDKAVPAPRVSTGFAYGGRGDALGYGSRYGDRGDVFGLALGSRSLRTQGLYLDGYGALFFIPVKYPLVPTEPAEQAQAKPKEPTDTVWSQTVREMSGQTGEEPQTARSAPAYDRLRVENLRKTLVQSLAHASNIRMRRPQDVITLAVGDLDASSRPTTSSTVQAFSTNGRVRSSTTQSPRTSSVAARKPASALLVLRTTKADVDAFAKGQLTLVQFTDKTQSLWSPADQAMPATAPAPTTGARR